MRLCLVSSILALILSMHVHSGWLLLNCLAVIVLVLSSWLYFYHGYNFSLFPVLMFVLVLTASYVYGQAWLASALESRLPAGQSGLIIEGRGEVVACDYSQPNIEKFQLKLIELKPSPQVDGLAIKRVNLANYLTRDNEARQISCADTLAFKAKLRAPYSFVNPAFYDYEAWLLSKSIDASGYLMSFQLLTSRDSLSLKLIRWRQQGIERAAQLPGLAGQLVPALLFGESGYLDKEYWSWLQLTGRVHLLVVSGLHIGFVVLLVWFLWLRLVQLEMLLGAQRSFLLRLAPIMLLVSCLFYAYMAGMGLAVQRSALMFLFAIIVSLQRSHWSVFDTWLWVMWIVLMLNPLASLFVGFWFSFIAVGCLLLAYSGSIVAEKHRQEVNAHFLSKYNGQVIFAAMVKPQWLVFIAIIPLLWMFNQPHSFLSLIVNLIAIPVLALVILPLSIMIMCVPAQPFVTLLNFVLEQGFSFLHWVSGHTDWLVYKPAGFWLILLLPLSVVACSLKGMPFRRFSLLLLMLVFMLPNTSSESAKDRLIIFDVGQGLSIYGGSRSGFKWLYDTGAKFRSGFSVGESVVAKNLISAGITDLDILFVSHSDNDHAGGQDGLSRRIKVERVLAGQPKVGEGNCHLLGSRWRMQDGVQWRVLSLDVQRNEQKKKDNNLSCVLQLQIAGKRVLIPGDVEKYVETRLVEQYGKALKSDILIIPHHGSKTSSSLDFIQAVSPSIAIVSSGFKNPFKHPHPDVLARYHNQGILIYNTADSGAIELFLPSLSVTQWRKLSNPIWRQM
jgi:competence protein ComEC